MLLDKIKDIYYSVWPYDYRIPQLWYRFTCAIWYKYRTVHPRTLPGNCWIDRDHLLVHCMFEILSKFIEKEQKEYKEEDWSHYYTDCPARLIKWGGTEKPSQFVLNYLYYWWKDIYIKKSEVIGDKWHQFNRLHCKYIMTPCEGTELVMWDTEWDTTENEATGKKLFKRYMNKEQALHKELEENLILLVKLKDYMWT